MSSNADGSIHHIGVKCRVKWFNQFKGYGFVEMEDAPGDIFLHFSVLDEAGIKKLSNGDIVLCDVDGEGDRQKVISITKILQLNKYEVSGRKPEKITAKIKWFNPAKGFGFAMMESGEDVFIHASLFRKLRKESLEHGSEVTMLVRYTNLGYEAVELLDVIEPTRESE